MTMECSITTASNITFTQAYKVNAASAEIPTRLAYKSETMNGPITSELLSNLWIWGLLFIINSCLPKTELTFSLSMFSKL